MNVSGLINKYYPVLIKINKNNNNREFYLSSSQAGGLAESTGLFADAEGGTAIVDAKFINDNESAYLEGVISINNIKLIKVPSLARLLSLASLKGIYDILNGEGINFIRTKIPFKFKSFFK